MLQNAIKGVTENIEVYLLVKHPDAQSFVKFWSTDKVSYFHYP